MWEEIDGVFLDALRDAEPCVPAFDRAWAGWGDARQKCRRSIQNQSEDTVRAMQQG
jgi:hypothetical protein